MPAPYPSPRPSSERATWQASASRLPSSPTSARHAVPCCAPGASTRRPDVDEGKIADIPGFGKNLTDKLVIWRAMKEKSFAYYAAPIVDPLEVQRIDRQLAARRTKLMKELRERIAQVEQRVASFNSGRAALWTQVEAAFNAGMLARLGV